MKNLGVGLSKPIVCYDTQNGIWASRAAFTLNAHGHPDVRVLDGGLTLWQASGKSVESGAVAKGDDTNFGFMFHRDHVACFEDVREISAGVEQVQLVDGRPAAAFQAGNIPGSISCPAPGFINANNSMKTP